MTSKIQEPRGSGGASIVSFNKVSRKNTTPSQRLNQHAYAGLRFFEMQKAVAVFQAIPTDENALNARRVGDAFHAAFCQIC